MKNQQEARAESRRKGTRIAIIIIGALVAVLGIAWIANIVGGDDDASSDEPSSTTVALVEPSDSTDATGDSTAPAVADGEIYEPTGEFVPTGCPSPDGSADTQQTFDSAPPMCLDPEQNYQAVVTTNTGEFTIALDQAKAPLTVNNFVYLARHHYFDATMCHRIITDFVVQCGDPDATGLGGPGYSFADELPEAGEYQIGSIAMANSGPNTNGSQFFIITGDQGVALPPSYSLFGEVTDGYDPTVVAMTDAASETGTPTSDVTLESVVITTS